MSNILITGITGFLGKNLTKHAIKDNHKIIGIANSELRTKIFESEFPNIKVYNVDLSNQDNQIKKIIKDNKIDYIIHTAALKHVNICEKNVLRTVDINILGTKKLIEAANEYNVKNIIGVSTDKAINPSCVYGMSKFFMEKMLLEQGYGVFQGVNFFYSSGSVLEIWDRQRIEHKKITVNSDSIRYFALIDDVSQKILKNLDNKNTFSINDCYKISILDLQKAYSLYYNYDNVEEYKMLSIEKIIEEPPKNIKIIDTDIQKIINLFKLRDNK